MILRKVLKMAATFSIVLACSVTSVNAANTSDTNLPNKVAVFDSNAAVTTELRSKQDNSSHYVKNECYCDLRIRSLDVNNGNHTRGGSAVVPSGTQRRIVNFVYETGFRSCKLSINTAAYTAPVRLVGKWSPDCAGSYTCAN